ncbi:TonB-dependent receptor [Alcanivorax sp. N3-2A]|nr:TonB-dependent receptor [Alcanivorax sp. N3-2A]
MKFNLHPLAGAISLLLASQISTPAVAADDAPTDSDNHTLEAVQVSALPLGSDSNLTPASFDLLEEDLLFQRSEATLGDTLDGLPGVHADTFGGGASRPVIRGQSAPRVSVLSDGASLFDASSISPDHATTVEPMLIRKVEVLRGPSTLLYGGGAIGGVVNVLDNRIPTRMPDGAVDGFIEARGNTVANEKAGAASVTARAGDHFAVHVEGSRRDADNYEVNGFTQKEIDGSYAESDNGSVGASWIGDQGYLGLAFTRRSDEYGLPGHNHEFEGCGANGSQLDCGDGGHDHEHGEEEAPPYVDLDSSRVDLRGEYRQPLDGIKAVRLRSGYTDYRHYEIEDGEIGTTFRNRGYDLRVEVEHEPLAGWSGVVGTQYADNDFSSEGEEALVPKTNTRVLGVFAVERYPFADNWQLELGARHEQQKLSPDDDGRDLPSSSESANSLSAALTWAFLPDYNVSLSVARSQRLPQAQEMYARGVHIATNTYECGLLSDAYTCGGTGNDADVEKETSHNIGLNLRKVSGRFTFDVGLFQNRVDNYIYARTLDQIEEFRLIKYTQDDVEFVGAEAEMSYQWTERLSTTLFGDTVRGQFDRGGDELPRIPADRLGVRVNTFWRAFDGELEFYRVFAQDQIAGFESRTSGYDMLNATLGYRFGGAQRYSVYLRGNNLLGEEIWNHASFLARTVPEPGRNLTVGLRMDF